MTTVVSMTPIPTRISHQFRRDLAAAAMPQEEDDESFPIPEGRVPPRGPLSRKVRELEDQWLPADEEYTEARQQRELRERELRRMQAQAERDSSEARQREIDETSAALADAKAYEVHARRELAKARNNLRLFYLSIPPTRRCVRAIPRRPACRQQSRQHSRSTRRAVEKSAAGDSGDGDPEPPTRRCLPAEVAP